MPAQDGQPLRLTPTEAEPGDDPEPRPDQTLEAVPLEMPATGAGSVDQPTDDGVEVRIGDLLAVDPGSVGVLDPASGGFGDDLWAGTDRALVEHLLSELPTRPRFVTVRDLMYRLLLSAAAVPEGEGASQGLLALRVAALSAMGETAGVRALLSAAPRDGAGPALARIRVDSLFLNYDNAGACDEVRALIRESQDVYWQKAFVFCQALAGQAAAAALGLDLLREQGLEDDVAFFAVADALAGIPGTEVDSLPEPSALHLAMMRADRHQLPSDVLQSDEPAILRTVAVSPNASLDLRIEAAERAESMGALSAIALSQLYDSVPFTEDELINALSMAETDYGPRNRALLYRAARMQALPTARAEVLQRAWELARRHDHYGSAVRVNLPLILDLVPATELAWFAGEGGRALYAAGERDRAKLWFDLASRQAGASAEAAAAAIALWPLTRLADAAAEPGWDPMLLGAWWDETRAADDDAAGRAILLYTLLEALGDPVGEADWLALLGAAPDEPSDPPASVLWRGLRAASEAGRLGETILFAIHLLGESRPGEVHPIVLGHVIDGLRRVGLEPDARRLAVEAAIGRGL